MKFLRHLLAGGKIFLYSDGKGNPVDNPAYRLSGGNLPGMWYAHATLTRAQTTRFDRVVFWVWWNDAGFRWFTKSARVARRLQAEGKI